MIEAPTSIHGERVICLFPLYRGRDVYDGAIVITTNDGGPNTVYTVARYYPDNGGSVMVGIEMPSLPTAIRTARQMAGWG